MGHLEQNNIFFRHSIWFPPKAFCRSSAITTVHDLALSLNITTRSDCILLDFSKAFDKVSHKLLLLKLKYYGITGETINWIESFFKSSRLFVKAPLQKLLVLLVDSVLGPLLFLIFINDLPSSIKSTCRLFADDCLLYRQINSKHDTEILQNDLLCLEHWANKWFMKFNPIKCVALTQSQYTLLIV